MQRQKTKRKLLNRLSVLSSACAENFFLIRLVQHFYAAQHKQDLFPSACLRLSGLTGYDQDAAFWLILYIFSLLFPDLNLASTQTGQRLFSVRWSCSGPRHVPGCQPSSKRENLSSNGSELASFADGPVPNFQLGRSQVVALLISRSSASPSSPS